MSIEKQLLADITFVETKTVLMSQIRFDPNNPNVMSDEKHEALDKVIIKYGFAKDPWLNDNGDGTFLVIDGEQGIKRLQAHNVKELQAKIFKVTYVEVQMLRQIANKLRGEHDRKKDAFEFKAIFEEDNLEMFSEFSAIPMEELQFELEKEFDMTFEKQEQEEIPEPPAEPKAKLGDIYQLGNHRIMCGDSTADMRKLMNKQATITITSPPYNLGENAKITGVKDSKYKNNTDDNKNYHKFLSDFTNNCLKHSIFTFINIQQLGNNKIDFINYLYEFKNHFVDRIIWDKENSIPHIAKNVLNSQFEDIIILKNTTNPKKVIDTGREFQGIISNVYKGTTKKEDIQKEHHAVFPIHLPTFLIQNFTKKNDTILDCFLGSGTTLIACEQTDRICYGMEIDPGYIDVIITRWENFTGKKAVLL